jgi:hypothetical protein
LVIGLLVIGGVGIGLLGIGLLGIGGGVVISGVLYPFFVYSRYSRNKRDPKGRRLVWVKYLAAKPKPA